MHPSKSVKLLFFCGDFFFSDLHGSFHVYELQNLSILDMKQITENDMVIPSHSDV